MAIQKLIVESAVSRDAAFYLIRSEEITTKQICYNDLIRTYHQPPLFFGIIDLINSCGYTIKQSGLIVSIISSVLFLIISYHASMHLISNNLFARAVVFVIGIHPKVLQFSISIQRDCLYLLLIITYMYLLFLYNKNSNRIIPASIGIITSAALLTRYEGIMLSVFFMIYFHVFWIRRKSLSGFVTGLVFFFLGLISFFYIFTSFYEINQITLFESYSQFFFQKSSSISVP